MNPLNNHQVTLHLSPRQVQLLRRSLFVLKRRIEGQPVSAPLADRAPTAEELDQLDWTLTKLLNTSVLPPV